MNPFFSKFMMMDSVLAKVLVLLFVAFTIWMLIDAVRRQEWLWVAFIFFFPLLNAPLYYFLVYRNAAPSISASIQIPGSRERSRIKELEAQIHHLDKAHHHLELGDIYYRKGDFAKALECYLRAMDRDPADIDVRAHLGRCLIQLGRASEARPLLETVCAEDPRHEYGQSLMALAETYQGLGDEERAIATWRRVLEDNAYAEARVQLAELYLASGNADAARAELEEVLRDDAHAPGFQRKRDAIWTKRAKQMLATI